MRILVCGGRDYNDKETIRTRLTDLKQRYPGQCSYTEGHQVRMSWRAGSVEHLGSRWSATLRSGLNMAKRRDRCGIKRCWTAGLIWWLLFQGDAVPQICWTGLD